MTCTECNYWYAEDDRPAFCHFIPRAPGEEAPCEYNEDTDWD